ncbi:substrate-binding domain-containing protein [Paraburkholderia silvatlantica]|uniref:LacI family transcriptional regulator n=1 Tax=Paraburkholderia silvatlantica TaxID=321895 RepID=A0A2U1AAD4_9BURK|nr:substrate-binding domain-containing protein [Paraburkholderia silvatlantica]MBB2928149.1 LacI family transcriptional regulator [Paraburkholderia silvatlantica]PVY31106.1 LacI family transcriptional regulator [Paraburkholderia silvatlantica]PXW37243.1 LacI family transcriptional regulator [Paraburkholderia silvatlantica]PYE19613.1 LacI family transcriptional regulator [Paraburkholderia silvatlantica]TDQ77523.1 LacI family transcriptional regulator [Paraburkholderia silvatlantica]
MKTSLKALASSLGLSKTTVSRALNGYDDVSEATRARVVAAAEALGYHADATARKLATGRANAVGIVYPFSAGDLGDPRFCEVVAGITEGLGDLDLIIVSARPNAELDTYRRLVDNRLVDAFIVARTLVDDPRIAFLHERDFPFVAYGRTNSEQPYFWFDFDNEAGAYAATKRLIDFGHRRIALVGAPLSLSFASQRREGFLRALREARIKPVARNMRQAAFDRDNGYQATLALLDSTSPPTAILVDNNLAGIGALRALRDRRRKPGKDISLIVYDGVPADSAAPYTVTAVSQPTGRDSGLALAGLVVAAIEGRTPPEHRLAEPYIEAGNTDGRLRV